MALENASSPSLLIFLLIPLPQFLPPQQGFDHLQSLVINLSAYPSGKVSKATILEKCEQI